VCDSIAIIAGCVLFATGMATVLEAAFSAREDARRLQASLNRWIRERI